MAMTLRRLASLAALLTLLGGGRLAGAEKPENLAQRAAASWLKQVDGGRYQRAWAQSANVFKSVATKDKWQELIAGVRKPLGKLVSRKVQSREYSEKLPGLPDGKYVVIKFDAVFKQKPAAVETVTATLDPGGVWRVAGYFVL